MCLLLFRRPRPDPYTQPGYPYAESHMKGLAGNNLPQTTAKMTKPLKNEQVSKPKPGKGFSGVVVKASAFHL